MTCGPRISICSVSFLLFLLLLLPLPFLLFSLFSLHSRLNKNWDKIHLCLRPTPFLILKLSVSPNSVFITPDWSSENPSSSCIRCFGTLISNRVSKLNIYSETFKNQFMQTLVSLRGH